MAFDLDPFDDILPDPATKIARAGGKFQPKAKPRPRNGSSVSVTSTQLVQTVDVVENGSTDLYSSLSTSEALRTKEPLGNCKDSLSGVHSSDDNKSSESVNPSLEYVVVRESVDPVDGLQSHSVMPETNGDWHSGFFFGLESFNDFFSQSTTGTVSTANRSPPKMDMDAELKNNFSTPCTVNAEAEDSVVSSKMTNFNVSDTRNTEEGLVIPAVSSFDVSTSRAYNAAPAPTCSEISMGLAPRSCEEAAVSNSGGDFYVDDRRLETEDMEVFPCLDKLDIMSKLTTSSGWRTGKFQPKPKVHIDKEKSRASISDQDAVECISCPQDSQLVHSEVECIDEISIPAFPPDHVVDFSSLRFGDIPTDPTSELTVNEEPTNIIGTSQSDADNPGQQMETVPEMPGEVVIQRAKHRKRKTNAISDLSLEHQNVSTSVQENEVRRTVRRLRKQINACELVDESEDEGHDYADFPAECPSVSVVDNDTAYHVENEPRNKRLPRKSKRPVAEKDKPVRKRNKAHEVTVQSTKEPPKRFSHSTRRNKRRVDKVLLETPEDEIDLQKLCIRDLILLAEHRERMVNKEATTSETPLTNHSGSNSFAHYNDETLASDNGGISDVEQTIPRVQESSTCYNYQSFMDKTPISRWSKQETELFYEAVRQFGTDLSMVQQLFPDRTRRQVKLKYKKEERQHPLRLREALTNRSKDHSHFELVIERLQQVAALGKENNADDSYGLTGEQEVELTPETNEVVAKSDEQVEEKVEDMEPDLLEVQSPLKSCDSEDDLYGWSQYKSEF
ncbi:uncharacterized protein LOC132268770 isoform X2 [Cornus florida]|uniref:uncharacterized protein LOC132268770 isoform X2 n=1 Tax=Cornus florida TaxID=4283 RepID=UPI00289C913B|nr:uncharacterized protein LOC132268770 isoform X2 [Cornus florida]